MKKWITQNKKIVLLIMLVVLLVAGVLDIAYKGLLYQILSSLLSLF